MPRNKLSVELNDCKIVILISVFERGGAERQAYLLSRELKRRYGLQVEVWSLTAPGSYATEFEALGILTRTLHFAAPGYRIEGVSRLPVPSRVLLLEDPRYPLRWVHRLWRIARQLRQGKVDILLPFTTWPNVIAGLTYRLAGVRLCIWGERSAGLERVPGLERIAVRQYKRFIANSTAGVEFLATEMGVARERIFVVPNGVERPMIDPSTNWRARLGLGPEHPLVVKVANLSKYKDHATLLRAWKIVQEAWPNGERPILALAGAFNDRYDDCRKISSEEGLDATVRFLGGISDVPALLQACDLTAFSSRAEGMPNGVLECMSAGKAVVASDLPGIRYALGPNADEVLVQPGNSQHFAREILDLLRNKEKRNALGEANRMRIRGEFSVERMADQYLQIIEAGLTGMMRTRWCANKSIERSKYIPRQPS